MSFDSNTYYYNNADSLTDTELQNYLHQSSPIQQHGFPVSNVPSDRKGKQPSSSKSDGLCYIQQLSVEIVTHIFARLDPVSLATVAKVCHHWRHIATDDTCWKSAFVSYFGTLPFKRLRKESWKSEYILRTHMIRKWEKGRGTVMQFNPKIGSISAISVDLENAYMLAASAERGLAVKCNPATGTVDRHILYSTDDGIPIRVNAVQVEGQRILWGFNPGYVTMTTRPKSVVGRQLRVFADFHQGAVTALALPSFVQDIVLSAGEDGTVKIWDVPSLSCVRSIVGIMDAATCLEVTRDYRVVAGYANGTIVTWNIRVDHLVKEFRDQLRGRNVGQRTSPPSSTNILDSRRIIAPTTVESSTPVQAIKHDGDVILVTHSGSSGIYKYNMNGERLGVYGYGHDTGTITCMEWDTAQVADDVSLQAAMKLRTKATEDAPSVYQNGKKSATRTQTTRILVTGDTAGTICVWDGDATSIDEHRIRPLRILHGHISPISALYVDACKIVSGSDDGWIRIWDPLLGVLVNVLGNKIPKSASIDRNDVSVMRVTNIRCDDYRGVATIGHQVKTWDFSPNKQMLNKRNLRKNVRAGAGEARKLHYEIKQEWKESAETMQQERMEREREAKELSKMTLGGLSDEEMLAYAMMLSQEQSGEVPSQDAPISKADYVDENDEELMMAMIASLETASIQNGSASSSSDDTLADWPAVGQESRKWENSSSAGTIWNDTPARMNANSNHDDEIDDELQYVLKMSEKEF